VFVDQLLEFATPAGLAEEAIVIAIGEKKLQNCFADPHNSLAVSVDDHTVRCGSRTGRRKSSHVLYFDYAEPAASVGGHLGMVAERGNVNAVFGQDLKYGLPFLAWDFLSLEICPIYGQGNEFCIHLCSLLDY
jgi:hypothetical protein